MRNMMKPLALAGAVALLTTSSALALTVDEAIARNIEARGGAQKWKDIKSIEVSGEMTSWSKKAPFTLQRTSDGKYHLDSIQDEKKYEAGYDGQLAWWENAFMGEGARKMRGNDLSLLMRELDFPTPLFTYKDKGYEAKLIGEKEFEGADAIAIELKRTDGQVETWYLDPKSFLEIGRESQGSDFGRAVPQRTYFDDFRDVSGVKVPFRVESQWYTRERIMNVQKAQANVLLDDAVFKMPPPPGMAPFVPLAGDWRVAVSRKRGPNAPWQDSERTSHIESLLSGNLIQETYTGSEGADVLRTISYDRVRKVYRVTETSDTASHLDVAEGAIDDQKRIVVTNVPTGTTTSQFGMTFHGRMIITDITPDSFKIVEDYSTDGGKEWIEALKTSYTRVKK